MKTGWHLRFWDRRSTADFRHYSSEEMLRRLNWLALRRNCRLELVRAPEGYVLYVKDNVIPDLVLWMYFNGNIHQVIAEAWKAA